MSDGHKSFQVYSSDVPDNQGVYDVNHQPVHLADGGPCHGGGHQDGGGGEEEKEKSEKTISKAQVDKK